MAYTIERGIAMKKVFVLIVMALTVLLCSACVANEEEDDMITYETGVFYDKNWNETIGTYSGEPVIPNADTALSIAEAIFDGMKKSEKAQGYVPQNVFYDEEDEIWIVSFWGDSKKDNLGGDCSIALQKKDGKVLRIWFGE